MDYVFPDYLSPEELKYRISEAETTFETSLLQLADRLSAEKDLFLMGLTGPTCSGKTTAAKLLTTCLSLNGRTIHVISIDDFYYEKDYLVALSKESGKDGLDYDSEKTIDTDLLRECTSSLLAGKPTLMPRFNFYTGFREKGVQLVPKKEDLFLFEGIQILYPNVSTLLKSEAYKSIAIFPQSSITVCGKTFLPNEIRLLRRIVRDMIYRGSSASFTFSLWKNVRENEEKNIFPYLDQCDLTVNSTMPYEIGVLKPFLVKILTEIKKDDPSFEAAAEILRSIQNVQTVNSAYISPNSLYREFI